jgi:hypothetical protein
MSSALDPTTDMAPLGKHRNFEKVRKLGWVVFPDPIRSSRYAARFGERFTVCSIRPIAFWLD